MRSCIFILLITLYFKILPLYASAFVCNDFIKEYSYQQSDLDYINIYKKMSKVKSELLMLEVKMEFIIILLKSLLFMLN